MDVDRVNAVETRLGASLHCVFASLQQYRVNRSIVALINWILSIALGRSPDPPSRKTQGTVPHNRHCSLQGDKPIEGRRIIKEMPSAGTHRTDECRKHGKGERSPSRIPTHFRKSPNQPNRHHPLDDARNVNNPSWN